MIYAYNKKIFYIFLIIFSFLLVPGVFAQQISYLAISRGSVISSASEFDYPPFCLVNEDGTAGGFSVELLTETLKAVGLNVSFKVGPWSEVKNDLEVGNVRVLPLVGRTPERESIFDFTAPYYSIEGSVFVRNNHNSIKSFDDLKDKEIVVMAGDNAEEYARREKISDFIIATETYDEAFKLLASGRYDAVITQTTMGKELLKKLNISNVTALNIPLIGFTQHFTFAVRENDKEMLEKLNEGLSIITINGIRQELEKKWFPLEKSNLISRENVIKYSIIFGGAALVLFLVILIFTLRIQVKSKTNKLVAEIDAHKKARVELGEFKKELEKKNKELENTLDDFYTMRIGIQKDLELGRIEEENEKIKRRLDNLKR